MTNTELMTLNAALEAKRQELVAQVCGAVADLTIETGQPELIDWVQSMTNRDVTASMLSRLSSTLSDVERSLRAIAENCYGTCMQCDRPIALKRLQSIPWATYCVQCQEQLEAEDESGAQNIDERRAA